MNIDTGGGAHIDGGADTGGGKLTGRDDESRNQRSDPRQTMRSGDINFNNRDNEIIYTQLLRMVEESGKDRERTYTVIHALDMKLDDMPNKLIALTGRVANLEKVEVSVKPGSGEVTIKTTPTDDSFHISQRAAVIIVFIMLLVVFVVVGWLSWRVAHG